MRSRLCAWLIALMVVTAGAWLAAAEGGGEDAEADGDSASGGGLSPAESLERFALADEFVIELVAAEPDVADPVALAWDAAGRMFVVEMGDYPAAEGVTGRVRMLVDDDGDGRYERSTVFADDIGFPKGVLPYRDGVLVTAAPDILFLADRDGDGVAEVREVMVTGFGEGNQQLRVNGLRYGIDNWIYGCNGRSNGQIRWADEPADAARPLTNTDFRFRPDSRELELAAGFSQFGLAFDKWGERFITWNTIHIRHVVLERDDLQRNPFAAIGDPAAHIADADHGDAGRVYTLTPPQDNFHDEPAGHFNAVSGIDVDRGSLFEPPYAGSAFVGEPLRGIVHRDVLEADGATFTARRGEQEQTREFLASRDPWFRPVNMRFGPDGALYIVDFYREWVEHPEFVPEQYRDAIDFRNGSDRGRIYRIRPRDSTGYEDRNLASLEADALVKLLSHPNGWQRETAQRLLVERGETAVRDRLETLAADGDSAVGRVHALWTLDGLNALEVRTIAAALGDEHPRVREHGVRLAEPRLGDHEELARAVRRLAADDDARVRFQVARTLGEQGGDEQSAMALAAIARRDLADRWTRAAVISGLRDSAATFLETWLAEGETGEAAADELQLLHDVAAIVAANPAIEDAGGVPLNQADELRGLAVLGGLVQGWQRTGQPVERRLDQVSGSEDWLQRARQMVADADARLDVRQLAVQLLAAGAREEDVERLAALLDPATPTDLQRTVAASLARADAAGAAPKLLAAWPTATQGVRRQIVEALLASDAGAAALLDGVAESQVQPGEIELVWRRRLLYWPEAAVREQAQAVLNQRNEQRAQVIERYEAALTLDGRAGRGAAVFAEHCAACHAIRGEAAAAAVGPDLSAVAGKPADQLLIDILDPNRQVSADYLSYVAMTDDGQAVMGPLVAETPEQLTLRQLDGSEVTIRRDKLVHFRATGQSLMPEGFEESLKPQDVADLLRFLREGEADAEPDEASD